MAKTISKTYSLTVVYRYDTGEDIADSDLNVSELRAEIKKKIGEVLPISKGNINAQLSGSVSES